MKAFIIERYGRKGGGRLGDMPEPELRDDDVLVQVHAAGVNPLTPRFAPENSSSSCLIACRSSWETMSPAS